MKKCPFCAEEIQEEAIVCKHCGRELGPQPLSPIVDYEYMDFIFKIPEAERRWTYTIGSGSESSIRLNAWQKYQGRILQEFDTFRNQGWEAVGDFGPGNIIVKYENINDSWNHLILGVSSAHLKSLPQSQKKSYVPRMFGITCLGVIVILMTGGLLLIPLILMNILMRYSTADSFKIKLRRRLNFSQA